MKPELNERENGMIESSGSISESQSDVSISEIASKERTNAYKKAPKIGAYIFFVLSILTFGAFLFFTIPFLQIFFDRNPETLEKAIGKVFGLLFTIIFMGLTGIPNLIFSLISTISFGTSIGKTDKPQKTKAIVFFAISLFVLLAAVTIAVISFIVIKQA